MIFYWDNNDYPTSVDTKIVIISLFSHYINFERYKWTTKMLCHHSFSFFVNVEAVTESLYKMFVQLLVITMIMYQASVSEACTGFSPPVSNGCLDCTYDNDVWTSSVTCR